MQYIGTLKTYTSKEIEKNPVSIGFECVDRDLIKPEKCYDAIGNCGIKFARVQTGWAKTEKEKGVYNFEWLDDMVDNLLERGVTPWFNVGYGNPIYMDNITNPTAVGCVPLLYGEECKNAWANFIRALAEHFRGRVNHYEIWNEADIVQFWYPGQPSGKEYAGLVRFTREIIKSVIPEAIIGICSSTTPSITFLHDLFKNLKPGEADFYCAHTYVRFPEECFVYNRYSETRKLMKKFGHTSCKLYMGEAGHASWHPVGHPRVPEGGGSEHRQAVWHLRRFFIDLSAGIEMTSIFQIADMREGVYTTVYRNDKKPAAQGILNGLVYTPKHSYYTLSRVSTVLSGDISLNDEVFYITTREITDVKDESIAKLLVERYPKKVTYTRNGKPVYAYWLPFPVETEAEIIYGATADIPFADIKTPVIIDLLTGKVYRVDEADIEREVYRLTNLPICDYPMLICDIDTFEIEFDE